MNTDAALDAENYEKAFVVPPLGGMGAM